MSLERPEATEFAPYYGSYVEHAANTLAAMNGATLPDLLTVQPVALRDVLRDVPDALVRHAYAPGKWTLGESLVHTVDTERVFSYRLLRIARADATPLAGFDQDAWVPVSGAAGRTLDDILTEIDVVRASTLALVYSLDDAALRRTGTASGNAVSARALVWIIAGHFSHHLELTRHRYIGGFTDV